MELKGHPRCVTYLNDDEILIVDTNNDRIQQINIQTGTVVKTLGKEGLGIGDFDIPGNVCLDEERRIVVTEFWNSRIQVISREGKTISIFGNFGSEKLILPKSCLPHKDKFFVSDTENHYIKAFDKSGTFLHEFGKKSIKMDNLTTRVICLQTAPIIFWCVISGIIELSSFSGRSLHR